MAGGDKHCLSVTSPILGIYKLSCSCPQQSSPGLGPVQRSLCQIIVFIIGSEAKQVIIMAGVSAGIHGRRRVVPTLLYFKKCEDFMPLAKKVYVISEFLVHE